MEAIEQRMKRLRIREEDLDERFVLGSGPGGQKINKTASCVSLKHLPTGLEIQCQDGRSREANRFIARERLCEKLEDRERQRKLDAARVRAKKRYANKKESRGQKAKRLQLKKIRAEKKGMRKKVFRRD